MFADPPAFCRIYSPVQLSCVFLIAFTCDALLLLRVVALFHERKLLCRALYILYGVAYSMELVIAIVYFILSTRSSGTVPEMDCASTESGANAPFIGTLATLPILLFNTLLFSLTLIKALPYWGSGKSGGGGAVHLVSVMARQGTLYFAVVFGSALFETFIPLVLGSLQPVTLSPWLVLVPIASNRLFLGLRKEAAASRGEGSTVAVPETLAFHAESAGSGSSGGTAAAEEGVEGGVIEIGPGLNVESRGGGVEV